MVNLGKVVVRLGLLLSLLVSVHGGAWAGAVFLTGHDPDFHTKSGRARTC